MQCAMVAHVQNPARMRVRGSDKMQGSEPTQLSKQQHCRHSYGYINVYARGGGGAYLQCALETLHSNVRCLRVQHVDLALEHRHGCTEFV